MRDRSTRQSGIGLVELFLGSTLVMVAVLGTVGGLMTSLKVAIDSKDSSLANELAIEVVESFRKVAEQDFSRAVREFHGRVIEAHHRRIYTRVILDETRFDPPQDLNGDGDCEDSGLDPRLVLAAYIETKVMWGRGDSREFVTLVESERARLRRIATAKPSR